MANEITVGTKVRSFDFDDHSIEGERACYVEGEVVGFAHKEGCERYVIFVTKRVFGGKTKDIGRTPPETHVYPPVNGIPKTFGGVTDFVEAV